MHWTSRLVLSISKGASTVNYSLPSTHSGRIVPLSWIGDSAVDSHNGLQPPRSSLWYFPLLKNPSFVAKMVWGEMIWLRKRYFISFYKSWPASSVCISRTNNIVHFFFRRSDHSKCIWNFRHLKQKISSIFFYVRRGRSNVNWQVTTRKIVLFIKFTQCSLFSDCLK